MPSKKKISKTQKAAYDKWIAVRKKQIDELASTIKNNKWLVLEHRRQAKRNKIAIASLNAWIARDRKAVANLYKKIAVIRKRMK